MSGEQVGARGYLRRPSQKYVCGCERSFAADQAGLKDDSAIRIYRPDIRDDNAPRDDSCRTQ